MSAKKTLFEALRDKENSEVANKLAYSSALMATLPIISFYTLKFFAFNLLLISLGYNLWRRVLLRHPDSVIALVKRRQDWWLHYQNGAFSRTRLVGQIYIGQVFIVLRFQAGLTRIPVVLARDALSTDHYRRCYVQLQRA